MPTQFTRLFTTLNNQPESIVQRHLPMLNSLTTSAVHYLNQTSQLAKKKALMKWYKSIPELTGFINKVARDTVAQYHFEPLTDAESGRNKVMKANKFAAQVLLRKEMKTEMVDELVTGEAFGWMGKLTKDQVSKEVSAIISKHSFFESKEQTKERYDRLMLELKAEEGLADTNSIDEDILRPRKYRCIASSTVEVIHDRYDILQYVQDVGGRKEVFMPKETIRYMLQSVDGRPSGYSSVEAVVVQLELLRFMWQNMLAVHQNGGAPDKLFILEDMKNINDPSYRRIEQQLEKYKLVENKHGNMLFTGKVTVEDLNSIDEMQFKEMGLYITGVIAMQWGISRSAIPYIVGGTNTKNDVGGDAESSYWECIRDFQMTKAEVMNTQLWIPHFGVKIVFDNPHVQFNVRDATAKQLEYANMITMNQILESNDKQLNLPTTLRLLGINNKNIEQKKEDPMEKIALANATAAPGAIGTSGQPKKDKPGAGEQNRRDSKRTEQAQTAASRGSSTGTGKESVWDVHAEVEYKEIIGNETMEVTVTNFVKLYEGDKRYQPGTPPRIFLRENDMYATFIYKSNDFVYKTIISNDKLEQNYIKLMNLDNIYRL